MCRHQHAGNQIWAVCSQLPTHTLTFTIRHTQVRLLVASSVLLIGGAPLNDPAATELSEARTNKLQINLQALVSTNHHAWPFRTEVHHALHAFSVLQVHCLGTCQFNTQTPFHRCHAASVPLCLPHSDAAVASPHLRSAA